VEGRASHSSGRLDPHPTLPPFRGKGSKRAYDFKYLWIEIVAPSYEQDKLKHIIAVLVEFLAGEMEIDIEGGGSTTFLRQDLARVSSLTNVSTFNTPSWYAGRNRLILPKTSHPTLLAKSTSPARR
jgi:hypothetical protein